MTPSVTVVVAAHDEEDVIGRRVENLLTLDYPPDRLEVVVASDGSTDGTDGAVEALAAGDARVRIARRPREGKTAAQDAVVAEATSEVVAFSDANATWAPDALRKLVRSFADSRGRLRVRPARARAARRDEPRAALLALRALGPGERIRSLPASPPGTAPSTRFVGRTTGRATPASGTTSDSPT